MKHEKLFPIVIAFIQCTFSYAEVTEIQCPSKIDAVESMQKIDKEWRISQDLGRRGKFLDTVSVYSGFPSEMGNLIPDQEVTKDRQRKYIWKFSSESSKNSWAVCSYTNSILLLSKPLPQEIERCVLTENILPTGVKLSIQGMVCE